MPLTDREIRAAKPRSKPYTLFDEKGMYLEVLPSGTKAFRVKAFVNGVEKRCSVGIFGDVSLDGKKVSLRGKKASLKLKDTPDLIERLAAREIVSLEEAREKRDGIRKLAANGMWIVDEKRKKRQGDADAKAEGKANLFGTWADRYYAHHEAGWSANHRRDIRRMIDVDIKPALGRIPGPTLKTEHVQALIDKIVERGALTHAADVKLYCSAIFKQANKKRPVKLENPVAYVDVPTAPKAERHPALELDQVGQFLVDLQFAVAEPITRIGMRLLLLTGLRTTELRCGRWSEVDERAREWRVPVTRTKAGIVHIVPLVGETLALLAQLRRLTGGGTLMFPNVLNPDEPMSDSTLLNLLYRMGLKGRMSGHGVRRLFSTWCNREGFSPDAIERQLGHVERNAVRAAYNEHDWIGERRKMMQAWASWLAEQERAAANVVSIGTARHAA